MKITKEFLKSLAAEIKSGKVKRKESKDGYVYGLGMLRYKYRHYHIAYCELRGRTRAEIEQPATDNTAAENYIYKIKAEIEARIMESSHEDVRSC